MLQFGPSLGSPCVFFFSFLSVREIKESRTVAGRSLFPMMLRSWKNRGHHPMCIHCFQPRTSWTHPNILHKSFQHFSKIEIKALKWKYIPATISSFSGHERLFHGHPLMQLIHSTFSTSLFTRKAISISFYLLLSIKKSYHHSQTRDYSNLSLQLDAFFKLKLSQEHIWAHVLLIFVSLLSSDRFVNHWCVGHRFDNIMLIQRKYLQLLGFILVL